MSLNLLAKVFIIFQYSQNVVDLLCCKDALTFVQHVSHQTIECLGKATSNVAGASLYWDIELFLSR